jgi:hypothetical protein
MNRLTMGAALGGLAVYLFDPESGEERRERLLSLWRENRGSAAQAGRVVSQAAESARPLARRMTKAVGRGDWTAAFDRGRPAISLPKLIGAAAVGGALVYFVDPAKGSELATAVKPLLGLVSNHLADSVDSVKSKVS